jgi:hypothetical protein
MTNTKPPIKRAVNLRRAAEKQGTNYTVDLTDPSSWPVIIQARSDHETVTQSRAGTHCEASFPVDRTHLNTMKEAFQGLGSPVHLPKRDRPILVTLTTPYGDDDRVLEPGTTVLVEGVHRFAAAFSLGRWKHIYCNRIHGTAEDVALLQGAANKAPVLPARSPEDIAKALVIMTRQGTTWPSIKDGVAYFKVSSRTYKRARRLAKEQLGEAPPERPATPDWLQAKLTKAQARHIRYVLKDIQRDLADEDIGVLMHRLACQIIGCNDGLKDRLVEAVQAASEGGVFPPDELADGDENEDF